MPFGLKNAGATYQRLVNKMFAEQLGKTMEVYIDHMLVKSLEEKDHVKHLQDCFKQLNLDNMKLNPAKYRFAVTSGEFLEYLVDKCLPFYDTLSGNKKFEWDERCEKAFQDLKVYLANPPVLANPVEGEAMFLYIAVSSTAVSGVLVREERGEQKPVFYVSRSLTKVEMRYLQMEKVALAVVMSARKLRSYFQSHSIVVLATLPLRSIVHSPSQSERLAKWAVEQSEYDIEYRNRSCVKSQVLKNSSLRRIPRGEKASAYALAALASTSDPGLKRVIPVDFIEKPSISVVDRVNLINPPEEEQEINEDNGVAYMDEDASQETTEYGSDKDWMGAIPTYIADGEVPSEKWVARKLKAQSARYILLDGNIFKQQFSGPLLTCVEGAEARKIMQEVHKGACGNHTCGRSLAIKIKRNGYYWPTMVKDCEKFSVKCEKCQRPLHKSKQKRFLLVLTDYFSKWVEADSYASIKDAQVEHFVRKNIICRHGLPYKIVTDNGSQFISARFEAFCEKCKIQLSKSTPRYPQENGHAEAANKTILDGLKKQLDAKKERWADELEEMLWSH
ncbi:uncharacterized protein LOC112086598 [Eutrema salsugineum]|uniref:uncharacterized protein LOC112086598 n=1 Tax=Eutrema salsugineum TaxID=72664 RepID=UPI000CED3402|nr:uncharacterized protein LOC112086598 [Eutrema salsugineum]